MLPLLMGLLLIASASVADYIPYRGDIPYEGYQYDATSTEAPNPIPIDYNDDFRARPKSNLYFSFEQIRRDQTSQVDVREEDIGRYMYRPKVTTTPAPALNEKREPVIIPDLFMPPIRTNHHWVEPAPTPMAPPPPAPSPKWEGFDLDFRYSPYSQYKPETRVPGPIYEYVLMPQNPETTVAPVTQPEYSQAPPKFHIQPTGEPLALENTLVTEATTTSTTTTVQPHWTEIAASTESHVQQPMAPVYSGVGAGRHHGRGSHRFNWQEPVGPAERTHPPLRPVVAAPARAPAPPAPRSHARPAVKSPPPPVPTLTPWEGDNFKH